MTELPYFQGLYISGLNSSLARRALLKCFRHGKILQNFQEMAFEMANRLKAARNCRAYHCPITARKLTAILHWPSSHAGTKSHRRASGGADRAPLARSVMVTGRFSLFDLFITMRFHLFILLRRRFAMAFRISGIKCMHALVTAEE